MPVTPRILPDSDCEVNGNVVEIGVTARYYVVEVEHWRPVADTVSRCKAHLNTRSVPARGTVLIVRRIDDNDRIDGQPLESEPRYGSAIAWRP